MKAGSLNTEVIIKKLTTGQDAIGQPVNTWENLIATGAGKLWADVLHLTGSESIKADAVASVVKASIRIRRRTDVTSAMRVHVGSSVYEIKAVLPDLKHKERSDLLCELING